MRTLNAIAAAALLAAAGGCALVFSGSSTRPHARSIAARPDPSAEPAPVAAETNTFDLAGFWALPTNVLFNTSALSRGEDDGVRWQGVMYTSEMYNGQPMRVFAWYALPKGTGPFPAVLSLHGAGGGADLQRAAEFARAGYACLSIDWNAFGEAGPKWTDGDPLPACEKTVYCGIWYRDWPSHFCAPGPGGDWKWCALYRAATAARRAISWLSLRPEIDAGRIGVEGHSFGGFLAQLVAGLDDRVKASVSSAAAGAWRSRVDAGTEAHIAEGGLSKEQAYGFLERYDPANTATNIAAPILLRLAAADFFGSYETLAEYWDSIPAPKTLELMPGPNHHFHDVASRVSWFNHVFGAAPDYPSIVSWNASPDFFGGKWSVSLRATGGRPVTHAEVCWTTSTNSLWKDREWCSAPLSDKGGGRFEGSFEPVRTGAPLRCFVSVLDADGRGASVLPVIHGLKARRRPPPDPVSGAEYAIARVADGADPLVALGKAASAGPAARTATTLGAERFLFRAVRDSRSLYIRFDVHDTSPWRAAFGPGAFDRVRLACSPPAGDGKNGAPFFRCEWKPSDNGEAAPADDATPAATLVRIRDGYSLVSSIPLSVFGDDPEAAMRALSISAEVDFGCCLAPECLGTASLAISAR